MASVGKAEAFFFYGTLREDDDTGATYTRDFLSGSKSVLGKVTGFQLYQKPGQPYPYAVRTDKPTDFIVGRFTFWKTPAEHALKLQQADHIEGYVPPVEEKSDEDTAAGKAISRASAVSGEYDRCVVMVETAEKAAVTAYMYYQNAFEAGSAHIKSGDWLQRAR